MANTIQHKRSSTATTVPTAGQLSAGELAVNTADGKLYLKKDNASIVQIGGPAAAGDLTGATLASGVTASSLTSVGTLASLTVTATIVGSVNGNAATATTATNVTTNANLTGHITSTGNATVLGTAAFSSANLAGALTDETGSGAAVFATSPTLVTPALGTPSALVGTNISGTGASFTAGTVTTNANLTGHITSTGNATVLGTAAFSSANLAGALTDETGTGSAVFATSPTLVTPALGTPSALVGTNISGTGASFTAGTVTTNANLTGHITSTGNATVLGTAAFSSANLAGALTDETGSGSAVFATSPTLVTPTIGAATATSVNKVTITAPATGSTLTVAEGKTLTASNTLTFTGTDASSVAFGAGGTVVYTSGLGTNVATFLATPSSANLAGALTDETGTGSVVFATSPTLITPALGTPSALVGTNISGTGASFTAGTVTTNANLTGHITSTGNATVLGTAAFSSANLAGALTDETGTGSAVFATSPTLVTPALGTPSALVGTNISGTGASFTAGTVTTNANLTGHITSTGNATVLGTAAFSSANLAGALTDETGSGAAVFATSPTLVTPALGTPTALVGTNISGTGASFTAGTATNATNVAITSDNTGTSYFIPFLSAATGNLGLKADAGTGASGLTYVPFSATLTTGTVTVTAVNATSILSGGAMDIGSNGIITIQPTDGNLVLAPITGDPIGGTSPSLTVDYTDGAAGLVTIAGGDLYLSTKTNAVSTVTPVKIIFEGATADGFETTLTVTDPTADRTITLPNATGTVALTTDLSQFAATSSAQLATLISDETGSGALVFATSPTLVTPILGVAAATSVTADAYIITSSGIQAKTASYSLVAGDNGKIITMNVATANTLTVPASLDVGFNCTVIQLGAGQTTITASGTTLNSYQGYLKISGQHGSASIVGYTSNVYNVAGNLSA